MICKRCGKSYEGNFCPYCGNISENIPKCPICGNTHLPSELYCTNCGFSYKKNNVIPKIYNFIDFLPFIILLIIATLVFLLNLAPFMTISVSNEVLGLEIPADTDFYTLLKADENVGIYGVSIAFIVVESVSIFIAFVYLLFIFFCHLIGKNYIVYRMNNSVRKISIFYFLSQIVLSIALWIEIDNLNEEVDAYKIGGGLIALMAISIFFLIVEIIIPKIKVLFVNYFNNAKDMRTLY